MHMTVWPLFILVGWEAFTNATSPFPLIGCLLIYYVIHMGFMTMMFAVMLDIMPLEVYHMPRWLKVDLKHSLWWGRYKLKDEYLKPAAERRAAKLRAQMGIPDRSRVVLSPTRSPLRTGRE